MNKITRMRDNGAQKTLTRTELRPYKTLLVPVLNGCETWKMSRGTTEQ